MPVFLIQTVLYQDNFVNFHQEYAFNAFKLQTAQQEKLVILPQDPVLNAFKILIAQQLDRAASLLKEFVDKYVKLIKIAEETLTATINPLLTHAPLILVFMMKIVLKALVSKDSA